MSALRAELDAAVAIVRRDWLILLSYRLRLLTQLVSLCFSVTLFHFIAKLVRVSSFRTPSAYFAFALVGLLTLQVLNSALHTPPSALRGELGAGTFERFVVSPFGGLRAMVAMTIFPLAYALLMAVGMLAFAAIAFGVHVQWSTLPLLAPVALLGALSFVPFGLLIMALVLVLKQALGAVTFVVAGISLVSGLYFPVSVLPAWMRELSRIQPFTPAADLMRHVMAGTPLHEPLGLEIAKLVGFPLFLLPLSLVALRLALRTGRRRGTLLEA